jgi:hypothetical protein
MTITLFIVTAAIIVLNVVMIYVTRRDIKKIDLVERDDRRHVGALNVEDPRVRVEVDSVLPVAFANSYQLMYASIRLRDSQAQVVVSILIAPEGRASQGNVAVLFARSAAEYVGEPESVDLSQALRLAVMAPQ